jgi:hypothetical protein
VVIRVVHVWSGPTEFRVVHEHRVVPPAEPPAVTIGVEALPVPLSEVALAMDPIRVPIDTAVEFSLSPKNAQGGASTIDGPPSAAPVDPAVARVVFDPNNPLHGWVTPLKAGDGTVNFSGDADLLPGDNEVHKIGGTVAVTFVDLEATDLGPTVVGQVPLSAVPGFVAPTAAPS